MPIRRLPTFAVANSHCSQVLHTMMLSNVTQGNGEDDGTVDSLAEFSDGSQADSMPWDTSDPFLTARERDVIRRVLECYVRQSIVFVGIPGNALCCVVFFKQGLSDQINLLLFWLAMADLINLTAQLLMMVRCYLVDATDIANWSAIAVSKIGYANWWTGHVSGTLMMVVGLDRCLSVVLPFKAKRLFNYRSVVGAIILSYLVPLIIVMPQFLASTVSWTVDPSTNRSMAYVDNTDWFPMDIGLAMDILNYFIIVTKPVILITMIVCCAVTVFHIRQASQNRLKMVGTLPEKEETRDSRITKMLTFLCFLYICFLFPDVCNGIAFKIVPEYYLLGKFHNTYIVVVHSLWVASCLNSAVNFFVYLLFSSRFQTTFKELCQYFGFKWTNDI